MAGSNIIKSFIQFIISVFLRNKRSKKGINPKDIKKILIIRHDALGDMIITLPSLYLLRRLAPNAEIHVLASKRNCGVLRNVNEVDKIIVAKDGNLSFFRQIISLRKYQYSHIITAITQRITKQGMIANIIGGRNAFKSLYYKGDDKYVFYNFQSKLSRKYTIEWERMYALFADTLSTSFETSDMQMSLAPDAKENNYIDEFLKANQIKGYAVINLSAGQQRNEIDIDKYLEIISYIKQNSSLDIILVFMPKDWEKAKRLQQKGVYLLEPAGILRVAELIRSAKVCISPDTSIVHLSCLIQTPTIGLYSNYVDAASWAPYRVKGGSIMFDENLTERLKFHFDNIFEK